MLHGHHGAGLFFAAVAKHNYPLHVYFFCSQFCDVLISILVYFMGVEKTSIQTNGINKVYPIVLEYVPYSHGLVFNLLYAALFSIFGGWMIGMCVFSHFILDFIVHIPDMDCCFPFGSCKLGLAMWTFRWISVVFESLIIIIGAISYVISVEKQARNKLIITLLPVLIFMILMTVLLPLSPPPKELGWWNGIQALLFYAFFMMLAWGIEKGWKRQLHQQKQK